MAMEWMCYVVGRLGLGFYYHGAGMPDIFERRIRIQLPWSASNSNMHNLLEQSLNARYTRLYGLLGGH